MNLISDSWIAYATKRQTVPSFAQFSQYIVDRYEKGQTLDEHWRPMNEFCSPCQFQFDVIAKVTYTVYTNP